MFFLFPFTFALAKCEISCMHGGRCIGTNLCRCAEGLSGDHCEIGHRQRYTCKRKCKHGDCMPNKTCKCKDGFFGRFCNRRKLVKIKKRKKRQNKCLTILFSTGVKKH